MRRLITALRHPKDYRWRALRPWRRHSLVLVVAGAMYICIGLAFTVTLDNPARDSALRVALAWMPLSGWGAVFAGAGVLAILSARWPPASETWGYSTLSGLSSLWTCFYLGGAVLGAGLAAVPGIFVWALVSFMWWAVAGLHNPEDLIVPTEEG